MSTPLDDGTEQERQILLIAYILHGIALFNGATAIAGAIVNHLKIEETSSAFVRSHHRWMIRSFWWGLMWVVIGSATAWILIGVPILIGVWIWWMYRTIRGFLAFNDRRPMPV